LRVEKVIRAFERLRRPFECLILGFEIGPRAFERVILPFDWPILAFDCPMGAFERAILLFDCPTFLFDCPVPRHCPGRPGFVSCIGTAWQPESEEVHAKGAKTAKTVLICFRWSRTAFQFCLAGDG